MKVTRKDIEDYLLELKFNPTHKGFVFLLCVLSDVVNKEEQINWKIMNLYSRTARKYATSVDAVERAVRYAMNSAGIKVTTKEFCIRTYYYFLHTK